MKFNAHTNMTGLHAFLSPSSYHWLNYDEEKLTNSFHTKRAAQRGTELHEFAAEAIRLGIRLTNNKQTINQYVNDAIGFRMTAEQPLFYSENCFGTADAIAFTKNKLRIHDLKTGVSRTSELQLYIYAALFCLEYGYKPFDIEYELRIYQEGDVRIYIPEPDEIAHVMDRIITSDKILKELRLTV